MQIIPLSEGAFSIDSSKQFVPFDKTSDDIQSRPTGSLLVEIQPFVVVTSEDVLLLDTGLGFTTGGELQLYHNLHAAGIAPQKITKVLMGHLHKDHAGGVSYTEAGTRRLSFPQATYYIQQNEFAFAREKGFPSYLLEELNCLEHAPNVQWLEGDGVIDGYIKYRVDGGHCPWHQSFTIVDGGETVFFGGDNAPQLQQMKSKFVAKYDYDGRKAMELRQQWWAEGQAAGWKFLFYHDIKTPVF
ncbi:MAG: MBL fold metallo-hydrolase [Flavihumibacter sp.]